MMQLWWICFKDHVCHQLGHVSAQSFKLSSSSTKTCWRNQGHFFMNTISSVCACSDVNCCFVYTHTHFWLQNGWHWFWEIQDVRSSCSALDSDVILDSYNFTLALLPEVIPLHQWRQSLQVWFLAAIVDFSNHIFQLPFYLIIISNKYFCYTLHWVEHAGILAASIFVVADCELYYDILFYV